MHTLDTLELDYMRCRSRNFQRFLEISITARFGILEKIFILVNLVIFDDVYIIELSIFDFPKFVYYENDASKCLAFFYSRNGINF